MCLVTLNQVQRKATKLLSAILEQLKPRARSSIHQIMDKKPNEDKGIILPLLIMP